MKETTTHWLKKPERRTMKKIITFITIMFLSIASYACRIIVVPPAPCPAEPYYYYPPVYRHPIPRRHPVSRRRCTPCRPMLPPEVTTIIYRDHYGVHTDTVIEYR